jgi:integrase/recombinase XerD
MSAASVHVVEYDPLRNKDYRNARLGPDVAAFLAWFELGGASPISVDNYERALAVVCRMYPLTPIELLTDAELAQVFRTFPAKSRRTRVAPYRTFFKWAKQTKRIVDNPMELIPTMRRQPRKPPEVFSPAEVETLLSLPIIDAAPLAVLFDAGLRNAEARKLTLRRCTLPQSEDESGWVNVIGGKGGKDREIPMSERLASFLAKLELYEGLKPDDHIFYGIRANGQGYHTVLRHRMIAEGTMSRWFHRCLSEAGIEPRKRTPHSCRHTYATSWRRRGLSADDLAVNLGHESARTTSDLYVQIHPVDVAMRMRAIEELEATSAESF